jgi:hypothetical protein
MILDTQYWFKNLIEDFNRSLGDAATNRVRENWEILSNYYGENETRLLQSLDGMVRELTFSKYYRDVGICTAIFRAHDQCHRTLLQSCCNISILLYLIDGHIPKIIDRQIKDIIWISASKYSRPKELPSRNCNMLGWSPWSRSRENILFFVSHQLRIKVRQINNYHCLYQIHVPSLIQIVYFDHPFDTVASQFGPVEDENQLNIACAPSKPQIRVS